MYYLFVLLLIYLFINFKKNFVKLFRNEILRNETFYANFQK